MGDVERIILGSGYMHIDEDTTFNEKTFDPSTFCKEENRFSYIQGGGTLEYKPTFYTGKDDMGKISKTVITDEEVTLKAGIMSFCGKTFEKLSDTARVTEVAATDGKKGRRTVKIGGVANRKGKNYIIVFHHTDPVDGDIWITIVGHNEAGFTLAFQKDKETVVDAEFKAAPQDSEGTLVRYDEEIPKQ